MDAFKLLTRSTKLKSAGYAAQTASSSTLTSRLPSAGKAENPQLFRSSDDDKSKSDEGSKQQGKKRKRPEDETEAGVEAQDVNLDFFSSAKGPAATTSSSSSKTTNGVKKDSEESVEEEEMDESQRRSILKTHKIKVTDLRDLEEIPAMKTTIKVKEEEPEKKKKKKKREKNQQEESTTPVLGKKQQKEARRLYPQPLTSFQQLRTRYHISRRLSENIAEQGFSVPTEVQLGSLPLLLGGDSSVWQKTGCREGTEPDLLVVAPTGSGKTLSFLIPVINKIVKHHHERPEERGIFAIIVAPTKELAGQIVNEGRKLVLGTGVKITLMKKGMSVVERDDEDEEDEKILDEKDSESEGSSSSSESDSDEEDKEDKEKNSVGKKQSRRRKKGTVTKSDILVTTPLLLVNALTANQTKEVAPLPTVMNLVLDEADVLLDPLFREQTLTIWRACTRPELRVSMWSATMPSSVEELIKSTIKSRRESLAPVAAAAEDESINKVPLLRLVVGLKDTAIPNITHKLIYAATEHGKLLGLRQLLHPTATISPTDIRLRPPFLIFTQTIPRAVALHSELLYDIPAEAGGSSRIAVLHSDLSDTQRSEIMKGFRKGEIWVLVTTDLLARGVDFRGINGVVNYDIPNSAAAYVHRVGRTGRAGREGGIAVTFYTKEDIPYVKSIANIIDASEKLRGKPDHEKSVQKWLLDALPDLSKKDKRELKRHGVKARSISVFKGDDVDPKLRSRMRISTKSGYERRVENKRKAAAEASRRRKKVMEQQQQQQQQQNFSGSEDDDEWNGFDD
ncbi:ATP-dependent RNA helicase rok1 [Thermoascus aurantiacus ATCC 26904]